MPRPCTGRASHGWPAARRGRQDMGAGARRGGCTRRAGFSAGRAQLLRWAALAGAHAGAWAWAWWAGLGCGACLAALGFAWRAACCAKARRARKQAACPPGAWRAWAPAWRRGRNAPIIAAQASRPRCAATGGHDRRPVRALAAARPPRGSRWPPGGLAGHCGQPRLCCLLPPFAAACRRLAPVFSPSLSQQPFKAATFFS